MEIKSSSKSSYDAQQNVETTAKVANWVFTAPSPSITIIPIFGIALLFSFILSPRPTDFIYTFTNYAFLAFAFPALIAAFGNYALLRLFGSEVYLRRTMLLALLDSIFVGIICVIFLPISNYLSMSKLEIFVFSYSVIAWVNYMVFIGTADSRPSRVILPTVFHSILGFLALYFVFQSEYNLHVVAMFFVFLCIFIVSVSIFIAISNAPMKRAFGVSGLEMMRCMLAHWTEGGKKGRDELENFFSSFGERLAVHIGIVSFRRRTDGTIKLLAVVPSVHPGPFGELGGSNLPDKLFLGLLKKKDVKFENLMVFHGPCTHDLNIAKSSEIEKITDKITAMLKEMNYTTSTSNFVRMKYQRDNDSLKVLNDKSESFELCGQTLGDTLMLIHTSSPEPTDDIDFATGYAIMERAKRYTKDALLIDAHNCIVRGCGAVSFGTKKSMAMIEVGEKIAKRLGLGSETKVDKGLEIGLEMKKNMIKSSIRVGYASTKKNAFNYENDGLGPYGIQVLIVDVNGEKVAYLLYDGNNMDKGLREKLRDSVKGIVNESEVLTTDNHIVNATMGGYNPVGKNMSHDLIVEKTVSLVKNAIENLEEVEIGTSSGYVEEVQVFGHENTARLTSVINSLISTMKLTSALSIAFAVSASILTIVLF